MEVRRLGSTRSRTAAVGLLCLVGLLVTPLQPAEGHAREVFLGNGCAHTSLEVRPHTIGISCDRTFKFYGIHWKRWGRPSAVGVGRARLQNCIPACAGGEVTRPRARLRLTHVVTFQGILMYARLVYSLRGRLPEEYTRHHGVIHVLPSY